MGSKFQNKFLIEKLNNENIIEVHEFCENNTDFWSQPVKYFKRVSIEESFHDPRLSIIIRDHSREIIGFMLGSKRILRNSNRITGYLKFFVVKREFRNKGLATWMLGKLIEEFKNQNCEGILNSFSTTPEYWFPGLNLKFTPAYFWMQKNGFNVVNLKFQNLYVNFNKTHFDIKNKAPTSVNGYKIHRINRKFFRKSLKFVKTEFPNGTWMDEVKITFENTPPSTFIAIDNEEIVGFASYNAFADASFGPAGVLKTLRGKGIGSLLLKTVIYAMISEGYEGVTINWVENETVKFYSKVVGAYISDVFYPMIRDKL